MTPTLAYIQVGLDTKWPVNDTAYTMWHGCQLLGIETRPFTFIQDIYRDLTPETAVHGWISNVKQALRHLKVTPPEVPDAPEPLRPWFGRKLWTTTMGEFRQRRTSEPVFIKPLRIQKAFTGHVSSGRVQDLIQTADMDDDLELLAQEPVTFLSEYRILVHHGLMVACRHYRGDFCLAPDMQVAREAIRAFKGQPCGYSLDLGVTDNGRTLIVEVNDAFSLGAYGTPSIIYAKVILDRWAEMVSGVTT